MPRITFAFLCAAVLAVLPACSSAGEEVGGASAAATGSSSSGSSSSGSSSSDSSAEGSSSGADTTPPLETSGTESAGAPQGGQGSLRVASLAIGAGADGDGCLRISFKGAASEVPADMSLVVTDITFDPDDVKFGGSACPQETPVCRPGLVLTETGSDECFASITTGGVAVGTKVKVQVKATVDCTGGQVPACVAYQEKLKSEQGGTDFEVPQPSQPDTTPTDQGTPPSVSDSSSDTSATTSS